MRAVGTEFSVNRRVREVLVTVVEGTVAVSAPTIVRPTRAESGSAALSPTANEILVGAGQQLALSRGASAGPPQLRAVDVNDAIAWTRRRLVFDSTPIEDVVAEFNRHSTRELVIQGADFRTSTSVARFLPRTSSRSCGFCAPNGESRSSKSRIGSSSCTVEVSTFQRNRSFPYE